MDVSAIYTLARTLTYTDSTQMPDATLAIFANIVYHDLENCIVSQVNEDFFYQEWLADTVIDQREYTFPVKSGTTAWMKKLLGVSVKYKSTDTEYQKLRESKLANNSDDLAYYQDGQPSTDPFFIIGDNSVFIYPDPEEVVTGGIKLYWVCNLGDIATSGTEVSVKIPIEHHEKIAIGMMQYIYQARGLLNEAISALNLYNQKKIDIVNDLSDRNKSPVTSLLPNLTYLK